MNELINVIVWAFSIWMGLQVLNAILSVMAYKHQREEIREQIEQKVHEIKVETHYDTEYWYDASSDQFLGQGKTLNEIVDHIRSRFPNHIFIHPSGILAGPDWTIKNDISEDRLKFYATK